MVTLCVDLIVVSLIFDKRTWRRGRLDDDPGKPGEEFYILIVEESDSKSSSLSLVGVEGKPQDT